MSGLRLVPLDTLFFRDGMPFASQSSSQSDVGGLFPPHPGTVVGALRAALARANGWDGRGRWPSTLNVVLGDGPDDLGRLRFAGPFVVHHGAPLFPMPRHLLGTWRPSGWQPEVALRPGPPVACDLGPAIRLPWAGPKVASEDLKPAPSRYLTRSGLATVLSGKLPSSSEAVALDAIPDASVHTIAHEERRIGIERDDSTRTAAEGMLYSARHVRLGAGAAIAGFLEGVPDDWALPLGRMIPLGGESRLVEWCDWDSELVTLLPALSAGGVTAEGRLMMIAVTPLDLDPMVVTGRSTLVLDGFRVRIVSACLERPQRIGGWSSVQRGPLPLHSVLAPGSVLFCEAVDAERVPEVLAQGHPLARVGARQEWGFGIVAIGRWPEEAEERE